MNTIKNEFDKSISDIKALSSIYEHLVNNVHLHLTDVSDLLRAQLVYAISAMDRYLHEMIRLGICQIFQGNRQQTDKFRGLPFTSEAIMSIWCDLSLTDAERLSMINEEVVKKFKTYAFQQTSKIKDGLSYIWTEPHKTKVIATAMNVPGNNDNEKDKFFCQQLDLYVERRNQIVHEGDIDPFTSQRREIDKATVDAAVLFVESFVNILHPFITT